MSSSIVEVCTIDKVETCPNSDNLDLVQVKGYQCAVSRNKYKKGDRVVFVADDYIIPSELASKLNITNYLSKGCRTKVVKLRGNYSYGLIIDADPSWQVGQDVGKLLGIKKYEPPIRPQDHIIQSQFGPSHPMFLRYTEIENINHFPKVMEGMEVVCTEKIHGCFREDQLVLMSDGHYKKINTIKIGDLVKSYCEKIKEFVNSKVIGVYNSGKSNIISWIEITLENDKKIVCTSDHLFLTDTGWKAASLLTEKDEIISVNNFSVM